MGLLHVSTDWQSHYAMFDSSGHPCDKQHWIWQARRVSLFRSTVLKSLYHRREAREISLSFFLSTFNCSDLSLNSRIFSQFWDTLYLLSFNHRFARNWKFWIRSIFSTADNSDLLIITLLFLTLYSSCWWKIAMCTVSCCDILPCCISSCISSDMISQLFSFHKSKFHNLISAQTHLRN